MYIVLVHFNMHKELGNTELAFTTFFSTYCRNISGFLLKLIKYIKFNNMMFLDHNILIYI